MIKIIWNSLYLGTPRFCKQCLYYYDPRDPMGSLVTYDPCCWLPPGSHIMATMWDRMWGIPVNSDRYYTGNIFISVKFTEIFTNRSAAELLPDLIWIYIGRQAPDRSLWPVQNMLRSSYEIYMKNHKLISRQHEPLSNEKRQQILHITYHDGAT